MVDRIRRAGRAAGWLAWNVPACLVFAVAAAIVEVHDQWRNRPERPQVADSQKKEDRKA